MLRELGFASRAALMDAVVPAAIRARRAAAAAAAAAREAEALARLRRLAAQQPRAEVVHRPGLLRHAHAGRDPAQRAREPGLVHGLHAVPAGDLAGPPRGAAQFPDDGVRPDRHGDRQRVDARRGDGGGRGDDAVPARRHVEEHALLRRRRRASRRRSTSCARAPAPLGIEVVVGPAGRRARGAMRSASCCSIRVPTATCATTARSSKPRMRTARWSSSRPTCSR